MTQPRPTSSELVEAVSEWLETEVMPELEGRLRFHARVAVNVLGIVGRELAEGERAGAAERERLAALLGDDGTAGDGTADDGTADELARRLAQRLRDGTIDPRTADLLAHLKATAAADLAIANPRYAGAPGPPEDSG